jgi:disulfide bond formation protein DsbB
MSPTEIKALVAFLQSLSGQITVQITEQDVAMAAARKEKKPAPTSTHAGFGLLSTKGCVACHDVTGSMRLVGPPLTHVGERLTAAEIRQSILEPDAVIAEGFMKGLMLQDFAKTLSAQELDQLVGYLSGEVGLAERLAHPAVHLLVLILLFNGGVAWAARKARFLSEATGSEDVSTGKSPWVWFAVLATAVLIGGVYFVFDARDAEPPAAQPAPMQVLETKPETPPDASPETALASESPDGEALFMVTCPSCHGADAKGVQGLGKDMTTSAFIKGLSDAELVEFIKLGRPVDDPLNTTGIPMPAKGLNMALSDDEILAIVKFIRSLSE